MQVPAALVPHVASLAAYDVAMGGPGVHRGLPSTTVTLVLPVDEPLSVSWADGDRVTGWSSVAGLHDAPAQIHHGGHQRGVQLALTTVGARTLLGVPAGELAGRLLDLDDLDDLDPPGSRGALRHLPERLAATPHPGRAALVARALADALAGQGESRPRAEVARALARLTRGAGVEQVAAEVGFSRRRLGTLVREETGLTPSGLRRVARFERARAMLGRAPLAEVATGCGYADQAHLSRDWRDLAGCTPTTWLREEFPFVQDDGAGAGQGGRHDHHR